MSTRYNLIINWKSLKIFKKNISLQIEINLDTYHQWEPISKERI